MNGLELSRLYYEEVGRPALQAAFPELFSRMAIGLAGEGSECFGFDDGISRDHDWGAAFCIWLGEADFERWGAQVQACYESLPGSFRGNPVCTGEPQDRARHGCQCTQQWYGRYTGTKAGPETLAQWRRIPEAFLATATNGEIFSDPLGEFSAVREKLRGGFPEDVRIKKLVARAAVMAQSGQYNYARCFRRDERVAARLALDEFLRTAMSMVYLLNRRYAPFYKWMHRGMKDLPILPEAYGMIRELCLAEEGAQTEELVEELCGAVAGELRRQGLTTCTGDFLLEYCDEMMTHIQDETLRRTHIMED